MNVEQITQAANKLQELDNLTLPEMQLYWTLANIFTLYRRRMISWEMCQAKRENAVTAFLDANAHYLRWLAAGGTWKSMQQSPNEIVRSLADSMNDIWSCKENNANE